MVQEVSEVQARVSQTLDVAAARYALKNLPESSDLLDKVRAIELAVAKRRALGAVSLFAALLFACAGQREGTDPPGCDLQVELSPELRDVGRAALERVNAATGCWVTDSPGGVPVRAVSVAIGSAGDPVCGNAAIARLRGEWYANVSIEVSTEVDGCMGVEATIAHEVLHAMIGGNGIHSESGVFAAKADVYRLDGSTLETVCSHMTCPVFSPE
jgi:hypothetical protein